MIITLLLYQAVSSQQGLSPINLCSSPEGSPETVSFFTMTALQVATENIWRQGSWLPGIFSTKQACSQFHLIHQKTWPGVQLESWFSLHMCSTGSQGQENRNRIPPFICDRNSPRRDGEWLLLLPYWLHSPEAQFHRTVEPRPTQCQASAPVLKSVPVLPCFLAPCSSLAGCLRARARPCNCFCSISACWIQPNYPSLSRPFWILIPSGSAKTFEQNKVGGKACCWEPFLEHRYSSSYKST